MALGGYIIDPVQVLINYPIAFTALGLVGFFRNYPLPNIAIGVFGRLLDHFFSGFWFF